MNGVMMPDASAGSNQVGASETWTPQVSWPGEAAAAKREPPVARPTAAANRTSRRPIAALPPTGYGSRPSGPELISASLQLPVIAGLAATLDQPRPAVAPFARGSNDESRAQSQPSRDVAKQRPISPRSIEPARVILRRGGYRARAAQTSSSTPAAVTSSHGLSPPALRCSPIESDPISVAVPGHGRCTPSFDLDFACACLIALMRASRADRVDGNPPFVSLASSNGLRLAHVGLRGGDMHISIAATVPNRPPTVTRPIRRSRGRSRQRCGAGRVASPYLLLIADDRLSARS